MSRTTNRHTAFRAGALVAAGVLVAGLGGPAAADKPSDAGRAPTATQIQFDSIDTPTIQPPDTTGTPASYIVQDVPFDVELSFWGLNDQGALAPLPLSDTKDTAVTVTGPGLSATVEVPAGDLGASFTGLTLADAADGVTLSASAPGPRRTVITGRSLPFDVLIESTEDTSIGGVVTDAACDAAEGDPICADLIAPAGGFTTSTLLSLGVCAEDAGGVGCLGSYVQALAGLALDRNDPATLVVKCDKTLCGGGAIQGNTLTVQLTANHEPTPAPACPAKGVVGEGQQFCVDYVQSTRDNSGDTHLYLLFVVDAKVRWM